jgi:hypothetical protein
MFTISMLRLKYLKIQSLDSPAAAQPFSTFNQSIHPKRIFLITIFSLVMLLNLALGCSPGLLNQAVVNPVVTPANSQLLPLQKNAGVNLPVFNPDFFLVGLYNVPISGFEDVKKRGFNSVHLYHDTQSLAEAEAYLQAADKMGLKVIQNMPHDYILAGDDFWINWVKVLSKYNALLWWYLPEEPTLRNVSHDSLARLYQIIRMYDPQKRPVVLYLGVFGPLEEWCDVEDIIFVGCYPEYSNEPRACMESYVDAARISCPTKALVGVPAFFDSKEFNKKGRYPTPQQARLDAYTAIIAGAKGINWFAYQEGIHLTDLWAGITSIAAELNTLGPILITPDVPQKIRLNIISGPINSPTTQSNDTYTSVQTLEKKYKGTSYLLASNLATGTVIVEFSGMGPEITAVQVLFEDRTLPVVNGTFIDTFPEAGVHVYRFIIGSKPYGKLVNFYALFNQFTLSEH